MQQQVLNPSSACVCLCVLCSQPSHSLCIIISTTAYRFVYCRQRTFNLARKIAVALCPTFCTYSLHADPVDSVDEEEEAKAKATAGKRNERYHDHHTVDISVIVSACVVGM